MSATPSVPPAGAPLRLRGRLVGAGRPVVMAVVNRTPDSFYPAARHDDASADAAVARALEEGADIVDLGGVRAGRGPEVSVAEEIERVVPLVARVRARHPELLVSIDTWRADVARAAADAGVDLVNDTWAGHDPHLVEVAAERGLGVVCSHTGGARPRTDPFRVAYPRRVPRRVGPASPGRDAASADVRVGDDAVDHGLDDAFAHGLDDAFAHGLDDAFAHGLDDAFAHGLDDDLDHGLDGVLDDVVATVSAGARRAVALGVDPASVLVDPTHDFGKNTWHSLHLVRRTEALVALGYPVLMALSRKDFVGESLDLPVDERLEGTLAATSVAAWLGARVFRTHDVAATRRTLDMVAVVRGDVPPARALRGIV